MARTVPIVAFSAAVSACTSAAPAPSVPPPARAENGMPVADPAEEDVGAADPADVAAVPPAETTPAVALRLPAEIAESLAAWPQVERVEIEIAADGTVEEVAVYHGNEAKVPSAVRKAAEAAYPGAKVVAYELEFEAGEGLVHEVEVVTKEGRRCELAAGPQGGVRYHECEADPRQLPAPVRKAAKVHGRIVKAERKEAGGTVTYTVEVEGREGTQALTLDGDGNVVGRRRRFEADVEVALGTR